MKSYAHPFVLAVSGGADSMYLLDWQARRAKRSGRRLVVAHVNYGLRDTANDDESFVREQAAQRGVPVRVYRVSAQERARMRNMEDWARRLRYRFFERVRLQIEQRTGERACILTAHTADDQAETVLMRLRTSAGLQGLSAMAYQRGTILRPMLGMRSADVRRRLTQRGVSWQEDETNHDLSLERNFVRHAVLPLLERHDPHVVRTLCDVAYLSALAQRAVQQTAAQQTAHSAPCAHKRIDRALFFELSPLYRFAVWRDLTGLTGRNGRELKELDRLLLEAKNGSVRPLSNGLIVRFERDTVEVTWQSNHLPRNQAARNQATRSVPAERNALRNAMQM